MRRYMYKHPTHPITKETRARNLVVRDRTRKVICEYIYEQTACEKCKVGQFCSRDGQYWGCISYTNISEHLNHIGHPTSRGNGWSKKNSSRPNQTRHEESVCKREVRVAKRTEQNS